VSPVSRKSGKIRAAHITPTTTPKAARSGLSSISVLALTCLLIISVTTNVALVLFQKRPGDTRTEASPHHLGIDTDGDGVPDHHDLCKSCSHNDCSTSLWTSGRATDFDGDGCQDDVEDTDKDNDGVKDSKDKCPRTPQHYAFISNALSDFDGDGCADGIEDSDDDGDLVSNSVDKCPRTQAGQTPDKAGCSRQQNQQLAESGGRKWWEVQTHNPFKRQTGESQVPENAPWWQSGLIALRGAWLECLLGTLITPVLRRVSGLATSLQKQLPSSPHGSIRRLSSGLLQKQGSMIHRLARWLLFYISFFGVVYACRLLRLKVNPM